LNINHYNVYSNSFIWDYFISSNNKLLYIDSLVSDNVSNSLSGGVNIVSLSPDVKDFINSGFNDVVNSVDNISNSFFNKLFDFSFIWWKLGLSRFSSWYVINNLLGNSSYSFLNSSFRYASSSSVVSCSNWVLLNMFIPSLHLIAGSHLSFTWSDVSSCMPFVTDKLNISFSNSFGSVFVWIFTFIISLIYLFSVILVILFPFLPIFILVSFRDKIVWIFDLRKTWNSNIFWIPFYVASISFIFLVLAWIYTYLWVVFVSFIYLVIWYIQLFLVWLVWSFWDLDIFYFLISLYFLFS